MKKMFSRLILVTALAAVLITDGCDFNNPFIDPWWDATPVDDDGAYFYTHDAFVVSFDSGGGSYVDLINGGTTNAPPQRVLANAKATVPGLVEKTGNFFDGWYANVSDTAPYNFDTAVTHDMTLYAKWENTGGHTVTFNLNFPIDSGLAETDLVYTPRLEEIADNAFAAEPLQFGLKEESPHSGDYVFSGWYKNTSDTTTYDFTTAVTADITLYAKWAKMGNGTGETPPSNVYAVSFVSKTSNTPPNQYIVAGAKIVNPFVQFKSGYSFGGWYTKSDFSGTEWDFTQPVDSAYDNATGLDGAGRKPVTLYAKWGAVDPIDIFKDLRILYFGYVLFAGGSTTYNQPSVPGNASILTDTDIKANNTVINTVRSLLANTSYRVMVIGHAYPTTPEDHKNPLNPSLTAISNGRVAAVKAKITTPAITGYDTTKTPILERSEGGRQALQDPTLSRRGEIVVFDVTTESVTP